MKYPLSTRPIIAISAIAALSIAATACTSDDGGAKDSDTSDIQLAAVLPNTSDPFFTTISCGAEAKAKELGVELKTYNSTSSEAASIASNFQTAQLSNPDGILVTPFNNNQFIAQYQALMRKGVPVVTGSPTNPQAEYQSIYSSTETAALAEEVLPLIAEGSGTTVVLGGAPGIPPLEQRTQPFIDEIQQQRSDLEVLETIYSGFDVNKATTSVSSLLLTHDDLKLIIASSGPDALGAAAAIKQAGKSGKVALIAFDAVPGEVDALRDGTITALIAQNPTEVGAQSVTALVEYLKEGKKGAVPTIEPQEIANRVLTADTVDSADAEPYLYASNC